jgi:hypothetical protein
MADFFGAGNKEGRFRAEDSESSEEEGRRILKRVNGMGERAGMRKGGSWQERLEERGWRCFVL